MPLQTFVTDSELSQEDKDLWFSIINKLEDFQVKVFEDFIENKEENLKVLTENLKSKTWAFKNFDEKELEEILKREKHV